MEQVTVTVLCMTYNHEKYIRKALDGIVMQKTSFKIQVIVHDDASTDNTPVIIKEYEKYNFIEPIYQKVNQYSLHLDKMRYINPLIKGKYVAYCEGDDYWTDENKLQIMVDYLEKNPDCSMCCHAYSNVMANSEKFVEEVKTLDRDGDIPIDCAIMYRKPPQLSSQIFRRDVVLNKPSIYLHRGVGDYTVYLLSGTRGKMHFLDKNMACHRVFADGSWTNRVYFDHQKRMDHFISMIDFLKDFDEENGFMFHNSVLKKINEYTYRLHKASFDYKKQKNSSLFKDENFKRKVFVFFGSIFPRIAKKIEMKAIFRKRK